MMCGDLKLTTPNASNGTARNPISVTVRTIAPRNSVADSVFSERVALPTERKMADDVHAHAHQRLNSWR